MKPEHRPIFEALSDAEFLALNGFCEASREPYDGIVAVESVVLNRVDHKKYANKPFNVVLDEVLMAKNQFSWMNSNDPQYRKALGIAGNFKNGLTVYPTLSTALDIANKLLGGEMARNVKATIYFNPKTATNKEFVECVHKKCTFEKTIGRHEFWIE